MSLFKIVTTTFIVLLSVCSAGAKNRDIVDNDDSLVFYLQKNNFELNGIQKSGAIILSETGSSYLNNNTLTYKIQRTIKVLSPNVKKEISIVKIPELGAMNARGIKGEIYHLEEGKIIKQKFSLDNTKSLSQSDSQLEFALPELQAGSIIHYSFTLEYFPVVTLANWQFQHMFPTLKSTFQNTVPSMLNCFIHLQSSVPFKKVSDDDELANLDAGIFTEDYGEGRERTTIWVRRNIPAFNPNTSGEDTAIEALGIRINMNAWSNWSVLNSLYFKYHTLYALAFEGNGFLKKTVNHLVVNKQSPLDKAQAIYNFVRDSITLNNDLFSTHIDLQKVLKNRQGNDRDVNVLLAAMLQNAGLTASPMLLRSKGQLSLNTSLPGLNNYVELGLSLNSREQQDLILQVAKGNMVPVAKLLEISYGRASKAIYANLKQMNQTGVYLQAEGKSYSLVVNQNKLSFGKLPMEVINQPAWIISKNGGFWGSLSNNPQ